MVVALHVQLCKATSWRLADKEVHVSLAEYSDSELAEYSGSSVNNCMSGTDIRQDR